MKAMMILAACFLVAASGYTGTPDRKASLFSNISDLRFQVRMDEYSLYNLSFGELAKSEGLKSKISSEKIKIETLEKEYISLLDKSQLESYMRWKKDEDLRDQSHSFSWWYMKQRSEGC